MADESRFAKGDLNSVMAAYPHVADWVRDFEEKCKEEFLDARTCFKEKTFWGLDSFIQVCYGLKMFNRESIK
ncbi:MAG: hypothetical protein VXY53_02185, partial [Candidatus Thermoplasmatota archaeon]|nr:hypothetical protein [Candidatus Thermoplasmatota archaeon]